MDGRHFDQIVRSLSAVATRRSILRRLAALPLGGALAAFLEEQQVSADGSGAGIGGNRNKHRRRNRKAHKSRREKRCQPRSKAKTCANTCGPVRNNCKKSVDCGPCMCVPDSHAQTCDGQCGDVLNNCGFSEDCGPCDCGVCPACHICDAASGDCVADANEEGESCGDGQFCRAEGICECDDVSCGACRTCGGDGACQDCAGCSDGAVCVEACGCAEECCDGLCCAAGEVCQDDACCAPNCTAVTCGSGAPETCGVTNCGTCSPGLVCIDGACEAVCAPGACPQDCGNCLASPTGAPICVTSTGSACTGSCRDDGDCCPGETCAAHPFACDGQFVCYVLGLPCA